jgi:hypothetical protein
MGRNDKGQRDDATTNQRNKRTDEQTDKAGVTNERQEVKTQREGMEAAVDFFGLLLGGVVM